MQKSSEVKTNEAHECHLYYLPAGMHHNAWVVEQTLCIFDKLKLSQGEHSVGELEQIGTKALQLPHFKKP